MDYCTTAVVVDSASIPNADGAISNTAVGSTRVLAAWQLAALRWHQAESTEDIEDRGLSPERLACPNLQPQSEHLKLRLRIYEEAAIPADIATPTSAPLLRACRTRIMHAWYSNSSSNTKAAGSTAAVAWGASTAVCCTSSTVVPALLLLLVATAVVVVRIIKRLWVGHTTTVSVNIRII